ncbi:MAG: hypothetical protein OXE04_07045 [bacterium]|nr:hypothetical protein [bacterium]
MDFMDPFASLHIDAPGEAIIDVASRADSRLYLIAPFITVRALSRVLEKVQPTVKTTVITRWHLMELLTGVNNVEIWPILSQRDDRLILQPRLHAKIALSDFEGIAGSANITEAGLGWTAVPNDEVVLPASGEYLQSLKSVVVRLVQTGVIVDELIYKEFCSQLEGLEEIKDFTSETHLTDVSEMKLPWTPLTRDPADLQALYFGDHHFLTNSAAASAAIDLAALDIPLRLTHNLFKIHVSVQLLQNPLVRELERELASPRRFGEALNVVRLWTGESRQEAVDRLQTLMRWLLYFQPDRWQYGKARYSETLEFVGPKAKQNQDFQTSRAHAL